MYCQNLHLIHKEVQGKFKDQYSRLSVVSFILDTLSLEALQEMHNMCIFSHRILMMATQM